MKYGFQTMLEDGLRIRNERRGYFFDLDRVEAEY